jgi:hypothetical protein
MRKVTLAAEYYQQFDADYGLDVPAEGYGGWKSAELEIDLEHTAAVVMHAWNSGPFDEYPGWYRAVEYIPRARAVLRTVFPPLLAAIRASGVKLYHVVGGGDYYRDLDGYRRAVQLAGQTRPLPQVDVDPTLAGLRGFRKRNVFVGEHNEEDVARGLRALDFAPEARPLDGEGVAENAEQLFALCRGDGTSHLIYAGFAVNWCLLMSPGGMLDMSRRGVMCSALRQACTAVESKETARLELNKEIALWRVALAFGFVFDVAEFQRAISSG